MKIELKEVYIKDLVKNYINNDEEGVLGYGGKLNIRPPYQREFIYKDKQRDEVIKTVQKGFPLNVMYWCANDDGTFELLDGQQRTLSICEYYNGNFSIDSKYFHSLTKDKQNQFLNYKLMIYVCKGEQSEKLEWFKTINIAGEELTDQELRNAIYTGPWLSDAKKIFSKTGCLAYKIGSDYLNGSTIRQDYLETALYWLCDKENYESIEDYMSKNQFTPNANELKMYFQSVINWVQTIFPKYRKEMKGIEWGVLYNDYKDVPQDSKKLEKEISALMQDDDVTNHKGIYSYVLTRDEKYLNIRLFSNTMKRQAYERQKGICAKCKKHFEIEEMEGDHITPWSKGGKTSAENCKMLCKECNRRKSDK